MSSDLGDKKNPGNNNKVTSSPNDKRNPVGRPKKQESANKSVSPSTSSATSPSKAGPSVIKTGPCFWCKKAKPLTFVQPLKQGNEEFCSQKCIYDFRQSTKLLKCVNCLGPIQTPTKETFCSIKCHKEREKNNNDEESKLTTTTPGSSETADASSTTPTVNLNSSDSETNNSLNTTPDTKPIVESPTSCCADNNNNSDTDTTTDVLAPPTNRMFQYELFSVFNWENYLNVSMT